MLHIVIPEFEYFNEDTQEFIKIEETHLNLEHSLLSLSKWESKWRKPFLNNPNKTSEETLDYIKCMTLNSNVSDDVYKYLSDQNLIDINNYINNPMTATTFSDDKAERKSKEIITSEVLYYWMITFQIPFECQKWHINRLMTLIKVCNLKNQPSKKMSNSDIYKRNRSLNQMRKSKLHTRG